MNTGAMGRPRIKRTVEPIEDPDGNVLLIRPGVDVDVRIEKPSETDRRLLAAFDGSRTVEHLYEEFGAGEVDQLIAQLREVELLEDGADDDLVEPEVLARFDRQLRYFSDIGPGGGSTPSQAQRRLREARVAILGVGGLGSWAAWALACCGIGELWLVDSDEVEVSNLNRQILYTEADIGRAKVEVAAERLLAFNSAMRVTATARRLESPKEVAEFVAGADVVVDAADWPAYEFEPWCNTACFEAGIPYITMSHFLPTARVGPLFVPGRTGCYSCQEIAWRRDYPLFDALIDQRRAIPHPAATLGPACGLIGGQVGIEVMHLLTGLCEPSTLGTAHLYDLRTMEVKREAVVPQPDCPVCGHLPHDPSSAEAVDG
jgi:bacteriocin biosynthesis cyclodehydratase domain-containing protein